MRTVSSSTLAQYYQAAHQRAILLERPNPAVLHVQGPDALDLLNRMSTNDLSDPSQSIPLTTVFTNAHARIVEIATVIPNDPEYLLLCWHDSPATLHNWLSGYIFFQDDVQIVESTFDWKLFDFIGPEAEQQLGSYEAFSSYNGEDVLQVSEVNLWKQPLGNLACVRLLCHDSVAEALITSQQQQPPPVQSDDLAELLRVESGSPAIGNEIGIETIPLEVGLWDAISFSKGCYIGQEIIARMESRGKLAHMLIGVSSDKPLLQGGSIHVDSRKIGEITSSAHSPRFGWIGLASVKPGSWVETSTITTNEDHPVRLQELPFD